MIIIFGRRSYGRVEACGSEYAQTTFAHVYYVPLIPVSSFWVTSEAGAQRTGYNIPLHGKSVLAAYLRVWAPIAAVIALASSSLAFSLPFAALMLGLSAWSWSWRSVRGELAQRRSDFNRLAFGMRCEPRVMAPDVRAQVTASLRSRWERSGAKRSPNDVGKFGATDTGEAVIAYGLLSLSAHEHGGRDERDAAERILRGTHDTLPAEDGPYREAAQPAPASVHQQVASAAATVEAQRVGAVQAALNQRKRETAPARRATRIGLGAALVAAIATGGLIESWSSLKSVKTLQLDDVMAASTGDFVTVHCESSRVLGELEVDGSVSRRVFMCDQGDHSMGVLADPDVKTLDGDVTGTLERSSYSDDAWYNEVRSEPGAVSRYVKVTSVCTTRAIAGLCFGGYGVALGLGVLCVRARRRAKRGAAAATTTA